MALYQHLAANRVIQNILVICTGNICRSPIAHGLLREKLGGRTIKSAGTSALTGHPADIAAIEVMAKMGHDITAHRARQLNRELLADAELVIAMDQHHCDWINTRFPEYRGRVHKLLRWRQNSDVQDPYCKPPKAFDAAFAVIEQGVLDWVKKL